MKRARMALAACIAVMLFAAGGVPVTGMKVRAEENTYVLENGRLRLSFDASTGLCSVKDGKTSKTWTQCYALPAAGEVAERYTFDDSLWDTVNAERTEADGEKAIRLKAVPSKESAVRMKFPARTITPASYVVRLSYKLDNAQDMKVIGNFHFERDGYTHLKTIVFDIASAESTTTTGWQTFEYAVPISEFPPYTNTYLVYFLVQGGPSASGSVTIKDAALVGAAADDAMPSISDVKLSGDKIFFSVNNYERRQASLAPLKAELYLNTEREDEVVFSLSAPEDEVYYQNINYPASFVSDEEDLYWMLPKDAGLYVPAYDLDNATNRAYSGGEFYAHMGFNMAFFGAVHNRSGDGYYAVIDNPALTRAMYLVCGTAQGKSAYVPQLSQIATKNHWAQDRTVRFRFVDGGGYVGIAKEYRKVAKEKGFLVTLKEKAETNPNVLRGAGAHRVDLAIDVTDLLRFFEKMSEAKVYNVMIKLSGLRNNGAYIDLNDLETLGLMQQIREKYSDFYLYEYEAYRDLFEKDGEFKSDPEYVKLASPYKLRNINGMVVNGWIDITGLSAVLICPTFGRKYLDYRMNKYPMETFPMPARMFDILATTSLSEGECYDENHPSDRLSCMDLRLDFVKYAAVDYHLDCHTEGAAEYLIPYVNSGEGPLDIMANNGVGINSMNISPSDRIPLWELVYHDCFGLYHHWEHGRMSQNPDMAGDDLFSVLYGERGMFLPYYQENPFYEGSVMDQMIARIKRISNVTEKVKLDEMVSHSFLSEDRMVQKTVFSSGVEVIVNFSDKTYEYRGGAVKAVDSSAGGGSERTAESGVSYTASKADGKLIPPKGELVVLTGSGKSSSSGLFGWILGAAIFVVAALGGQAALMLHLRKKRRTKDTEDKNS